MSDKLKNELRSDHDDLYTKINARVRQYIVENLSPDVPRFIQDYNTKRQKLDACREMRVDIGRYMSRVHRPHWISNSGATHVEWLFNYYLEGRDKAKESMFDDNATDMTKGITIKKKFIPFFVGMGQHYKKNILWGLSPLRKFVIWICRVFGMRNELDTFILSRAMHVLVQSSAYDFYLDELKSDCKTARDTLLGRLGKFGALPSSTATDPAQFIKYGNVIDELHTFPEDLQDELKSDVEKLATLKKELDG